MFTSTPPHSPLLSIDEPIAVHTARPRLGERPGERDQLSEVAMDDTLAASFPASDPPAWNPGVAHPGVVENERTPAE